MRKPDFVIGPPESPYMNRWWVIPRNRFFNIYLHQMLRDDDDRALHDHPWWNLSIVLRGGYWEHAGRFVYRRRPGSLVLRRPTMAHRLELPEGVRESWSLFITGPVVRKWGFHCPKGWVYWRDFVTVREGGNEAGAGCGE